MKSRVISRNAGSQSCFHSEYFSSIGKMPKLRDPTLSEAISGEVATAACSRSSRVMPRPPPVDTFSTASQPAAMAGMNSVNSSGRGSGWPVSGLRACRWMIAAPACSRFDRRGGDLLGGDRQVGRHRRGVDAAGGCTRHDDGLRAGHRGPPPPTSARWSASRPTVPDRPGAAIRGSGGRHARTARIPIVTDRTRSDPGRTPASASRAARSRRGRCPAVGAHRRCTHGLDLGVLQLGGLE